MLFEFLMRGLLQHRYLHADPNLANFAFLEDGRVLQSSDDTDLKSTPSERNLR